MEVVQLLAIALALLAFFAAHRLRSKHAHAAAKPMPTIEVGDPGVARRLIIDHADSFSNHPNAALAVDLDAGQHKTESITSAPYGQLWSVLRRDLTVNILHPSRIGHLVVPLQKDAVDALVADLSARKPCEEVVVRDGVYAAVFATVARLCFGDDGVSERDVAVMRRTLHEFFHSNLDNNLLARSRLARLVHWRQWSYLVNTRRRLAEVFGPVVEARRQSRRSNGGDGSFSSYLDSLLDLRVPTNDVDEIAGGQSLGARRALMDDEVVRLVWEFLGSSTQAVVACVEWTLARLVTEPEVQKKLYHDLIIAAGDHRRGQVSDERLQDLPYLRAVILESLRLHPPIPTMLRDVGPDGAAAAGAPPPPPDGTPVRFMFDAQQMGRDQKAWTDPDEFRPERFLAGGEGEDVSPVPGPKEIKMMPFGAGRRHCPGAGLSMITVGCFVSALVREFEWSPPADGGSGVDLAGINALFVKVMASPLRVRITPRTSQSH